MAETREHYVSCHSHWSSWDSLYTLSEDTLGEEMEAWETFQYNSLENKELWSGQAESEEGQCEDCQVRRVVISLTDVRRNMISLTDVRRNNC